jgi:pimeloyl-ACP methyl ester carboxylesterase
MNRPSNIELDHRLPNLSTYDVTTTTHDVPTRDNRQLIRVIEADGRNSDSGETIILPASYKSRGDKPAEMRTSILAARLNARVAYIETPGIGINQDAGRLSPSQLLSIARGNYDTLAAVQLTALDDVLHFSDGQEVRFIGYSMGSWAAAAMARRLARGHFVDKTLRIPRIDLIEAVNDQAYQTLDLYRRIQQESIYIQRYYDENTENGITALTQQGAVAAGLDKQQTVALSALSIGIPRGKFATVLTQAIDESQTTTQLNEGSIHFWRANESLVAREDANRRTISQLGKLAYVSMTQIIPSSASLPHRHALFNSVGLVSNLAEHLRETPHVYPQA